MSLLGIADTTQTGATPTAPVSGKSDAQKQRTASKQLTSSLSRIDGSRGNVDPASQSGTLLGYANAGKQTFEQQKDNLRRNPLEDLGSGFLAGLNIPSQIVLRQVQAQQTGTSHWDALKKALDVTQHQTNLRGALNTDNFQTGKGFISPQAEAAAERQGGRVAGAFDLFGTAATDPLSFVSGGSSLLGKAGKATAGLTALEKAGGADIAAQAAKQGTKSFSPEVAARLRAALEAAPEAQDIKPGLIGRILGKEATPQTYADRILGGVGNALTRERGLLEEPQGLKFAGKTILAKTAFDKGAERIGAKGAVDALSRLTPVASTVGRLGDVVNKFTPRGQIAGELGQQAADNQGLLEAGARSKVAEQTADLTRHFNQIEDRLGKEGINPDDLGRLFTPILESGQWKQAVDTYRAAGRNTEADYLQATHDLLRVAPTQSRLEAGTLKVARPVDSYVSRQARPEAVKQLQKIKNVPDELMSYAQDSKGVGTEQQARKFMPDASIAEANAAIEEKTGIKDFFEPNAVKALGRKAVASYDELAKVDMLKKIGEFKDEAGNSLLTLVPNPTRHVRDVKTAATAELKNLDKEIRKAETATKRELVKDSTGKGASKVATAFIQRYTKRITELESLLSKAESSKIKASMTAGAAKSAGTAAKLGEPQYSAKAIRAERDAILEDPTIPDYIRSEIRKDYGDAMKVATNERLARSGFNAAETARTGKKSVQQSIGATNTAAKYENILAKSVKRQLAQAEQDLALAQRRNSSAALSGQESKAALDALKQQRSDLVKQSKAQIKQLKDDAKVDRPSGFVAVKIRSLDQEAYMPRSMAQRLQELEGQGKVGSVQKSFETGTQVIKNLLLNSTPLLVARNTRDFLPNIVNMVAVGFKDPTTFKTAAKVDLMLRKSYKAGLTHQQAIDALPEKYRNLERKISEYGTVNTNQQRSDVSHNVGIGESNATNAKIKRKLNYKNAEAFGTKLGAESNDFVDNLSRRAMFYDQVAQHGDFKLAAQNTKKALFDYADLGEAEKKIRRFVVFWTFTARNAKLQAWTLAHAPQVPLNVDRFKNEVVGDDSSGNTILPGYAVASGQVSLGKVGKTPILGNIQSPFESAAQSIQPLADIASYFGPEKTTTTAGLRGGIAGLSQNIGGAPGVLGKTIVEQGTGQDLFTGAPLKGTKSEQLQRALLTAAPRGTQYQGLAKAGTSGTSAERAAAALKLAGVSSTAVTQGKQTSELYRRNRAVTESADRQGIPTVTALKKSATKKKTTQKK